LQGKDRGHYVMGHKLKSDDTLEPAKKKIQRLFNPLSGTEVPVLKLPIPVAVRSKVYVCSRLFVGIAGSDSAKGMECSSRAFVVFCVSSDLCDGLIIHSEESYRVCVCVFMPNCVRSKDLNNEAAYARIGPSNHNC